MYIAQPFKRRLSQYWSISVVTLVLQTVLLDQAMAADVTGSWEYVGPRSSGLWLKTQQTGHQVRFQLELQRGAPSYNSGWIEGTFELQGATGIFSQADNDAVCEIAFDFQPRQVVLKSKDLNGGCGFGFNVYADGALKRKSTKPPKFTPGDPR